MSRESFAERLVEMKRRPWPRASAERLRMAFEPPETWVDLIERAAIVDQIDGYLRRYLAPVVEGDEIVKNDCPCCRSRGFFGWGLSWGAGTCSCGWPARLYHVIVDVRPDPDLFCDRTVNGERRCSARRGAHVEREQVWQTAEGPRVETVLACPGSEGTFDTYRPPQIVRFNLLLWAHPYSVALS